VEPIEGIRLKVERAEHVLDELYAAVVDYLSEHNYEVVGEYERERSEYVFRGRVTKATAYLSVIAGDVVHNMRSALDHLAWQLALLTTPTPYDLTQLPIALTPAEFSSKRGKAMIQDLTPEHRARIETFQPYNRSKERGASFAPFALRDLRFLSNTDKHRLLNATVARKTRQLQPRGLGVSIVRDIDAYGEVTWLPEGDSIDGAVVARVPVEGVGPNPKMKMEGEIPVTVSFNDPADPRATGSFPFAEGYSHRRPRSRLRVRTRPVDGPARAADGPVLSLEGIVALLTGEQVFV
jgi:hypothetical protein